MEGRSSLLRSDNMANALGYSTFDPGGSIDSGISNSTDDSISRTNGLTSAAVVEEASERVSISWENIQIFVEQPGPSFLKILCMGQKRTKHREASKSCSTVGEVFE